ncbi:DUF1428 domain-containing protein [Bradymonadaceae bacterium TMQ3]|nr:DUF1428 domain-containing protein [Bradymonadaceae bacterium TMQ3]TXC74515.1 DUF1428 domain-containing protein [Bradymonadales bacterium TMQ1]
MSYIDGFVGAVPAANKDAYRQHVLEAVPLFKESGVARMVETWGDDVGKGEVTDFFRAVEATAEEVIVFSWMEYPDREARQAANERMMSDEHMGAAVEQMPFDGERMIYGGFATILDKDSGAEPGYIDGSVIPVPTANKDAYTELAAMRAEVMMEHGATRVVNAWGDDVPDGKRTDFKRAVNATAEESVVFARVEWPSKEVRDAAWPKIYGDARMHTEKGLFEGERMIFGGFAPLLDV